MRYLRGMKREGGTGEPVEGADAVHGSTAVKKEGGPKQKRKRVTVKKEKGKKVSGLDTTAEARLVDWEAAVEGLANLHPEVTSKNVARRDELLKSCGAGSSVILDAVISTMLSQNTTDKNAHEAYRNLTEKFPTWR